MTAISSNVGGSPSELPFIDRRQASESRGSDERRQFGNTYHDLSPDARELAVAIDEYKVAKRRRYITPDELLSVIQKLGYSRD